MPIKSEPIPKGAICHKCKSEINDGKGFAINWPYPFQLKDLVPICEKCHLEYLAKYHILHVEYFGE